MSDSSEVVCFQNVGARYGVGSEVLHDLSFILPRGSFQFLTGPSGAGKSSLLRLMALSHRPSRGRVSVFEHDLALTPRAALPALRRRIGIVSPDCPLLDHLSALDNVALPLRISGVREELVRDHVAELLAWVGMSAQVDKRPPTLSDGQKQRVAIARAVIARPDLLLADEPTGNVDAELGDRLLGLFEELNHLGTTVVVATHDQSLIRRFSHPVMRLDDGALTMAWQRRPLTA